MEDTLRSVQTKAEELELRFRKQKLKRNTSVEVKAGLVQLSNGTGIQKTPSDLKVGEMLEKLLPRLIEEIEKNWVYLNTDVQDRRVFTPKQGSKTIQINYSSESITLAVYEKDTSRQNIYLDLSRLIVFF